MRTWLKGLLLLMSLGSGVLSGASDQANPFTGLTQKLEANPENSAAANQLRQQCKSERKYDHCIELFDALAAKYPDSRTIRYHAALAYIDKLPGLSLLAQARLSTKSMEHASAILEKDSQDWLALYIRGLNNLYWPRWYNRVPRAIRDLQACVEVSRSHVAQPAPPYMVLGYVALGDGLLKTGDEQGARRVWESGLAVHRSTQLQQRLERNGAGLLELVEGIRDRDRPIDTDLSFLIAGDINRL